MFYNLADANAYLKDSVIMLLPEHTPVYVVGVLAHKIGDYEVQYILLTDLVSYTTARDPSKYIKTTPIKSITWKGMRLGYTQIKDKAYYTSRIPARQWKKGLTRNNVHFNTGGEGFPLPWTSWMGEPLHKTLVGDYISFDEAFDKVLEYDRDKPAEHLKVSVAFNRYLALTIDTLGIYKLLLKGEEVAFNVGDKKTFKLGANHEYLKEILTHNGVPLA